MKHKFHIISHNPYSGTKGIRCIKDGANAIEPHIRYLPQYDSKLIVYDLATLNHKQRTLSYNLFDLSGALTKKN